MHAQYKLVIAQKYLALEIRPRRSRFDALCYELRITLLCQAAPFGKLRQQSIHIQLHQIRGQV